MSPARARGALARARAASFALVALASLVMLGVAPGAASAAGARRKTPVAGESRASESRIAKQRGKKQRASKQRAKRKHATRDRRPTKVKQVRGGTRVATSDKDTRTGSRGTRAKKGGRPGPGGIEATTSTPLVKVATLQADGRVRYGADRMPPGFAWPPTPQMVTASRACEQSLDALGIEWKPAKAEGMIVDPIVVPSMEIGGITYTSTYRRGPHVLDCQFVQALAQIGPQLRALGLREVRFGSIYRNTLARSHGERKAFKSRHALGIAMDITAFVHESGRVANVELEYLRGDPLLHGIEDAINHDTRFRWVLTPGNDPISHADHFHIEASVDFTAFR